MQYPTLTEPYSSRDYVSAFGGYDRRVSAAENEFFAMRNLASDQYPCASPRKPRGLREKSRDRNAVALLSGQNLAYAAEGKLWVKDAPVMDLSDELPKRLIAMGAYIVVLPDKVYYNTAKPEDYGALEQTYSADGTVTFTLCQQDGTGYASAPVRQPDAPDEPDNLALWLDTSQTPHVLKQFAASTGLWTSLATVYTKISAAGIGSGFAAGDGVKITGIPADIGQLAEFDGKDIVLTKAAENEIVVVGLIEEATEITGGLTIERKLPVMDYVFESGNRLWGCRYGENAAGDFVNEIYCSKLGDFKNWFCYEGLSSDSYAASVGSDGPFTGAIAFHGNPLFFKSDCLHKLYGAYPAAFQIQQFPGFRGVQNGSADSLAILNELLYYMSDNGVCVYDGSSTQEIFAVFDRKRYHGAVAGAFANKYYISMLDDAETPVFAVYDVETGMWHLEDETRATGFAVSGTNLYYIDGGKIRSVLARENTEAAPIEWYGETGLIGINAPGYQDRQNAAPEQKLITRVNLRLTLLPGTVFRLYIQYDDDPQWIHITSLTGNSMRSFSLPVMPRRCDHFRLRIEGRGDFLLHTLSKTVETGSVLP